MQINNCNSYHSFGNIYFNNWEMEYLKKENVKCPSILNGEQNSCNDLLWLIDKNSDGYKLINNYNKQIYSEPFSVKKHFGKGKLSILMKNINNNTVSFSIPLSKEDISFWYKNIKNSTGIEKMIKILKVLEFKK